MPSQSNNAPRWLLDELLDDPHAWRDYASCIGIGEEYDDILFPFNPKTRDDEGISEFKYEYCSECPVKDWCLDFAVKTESIGVWGGIELTPRKTARLGRLRKAEGPVTVDRAKETLGEADEFQA